MPREDHIEFEGEVVECLRNITFRVELETGQVVICTLSGKMRKNYIRISNGEKVKVAVSPYDLTRGIITRRTS